MPLGAAITVLVIGVVGLAFTGYLTVRFIAARRRGEMRLSAFNSFMGKWVDLTNGTTAASSGTLGSNSR